MELKEIIEQLESCKFECQAGPLENNTAFIALKEYAELEEEREIQELADAACDEWLESQREEE